MRAATGSTTRSLASRSRRSIMRPPSSLMPRSRFLPTGHDHGDEEHRDRRAGTDPALRDHPFRTATIDPVAWCPLHGPRARRSPRPIATRGSCPREPGPPPTDSRRPTREAPNAQPGSSLTDQHPGESMKNYDVVVIGGGAGGLVAAKEARRRKASVVIVQDGPLGGDCTFTGCVPSKALLAAAAAGHGFDESMRRVHAAIETIAATEDSAALAREGIDVIAGYARFRSPTSIEVNGDTVRSRRFIVATGATALIPPIPGLRDSRPLTNETLFTLDRLPPSLAVLGGGPIGCEMAQAFARLGSTVTLLETADRILPREEPEASAVVERALARDGVTVRAGAAAT
ncbi:MAG: FAD-dependent oxidoreductase, partial [Actinobacteria bacterium]|nr:FAD-dependent oxidoreductase [Actinomycetota bacterium]